jgi:uncharacterized OsmC-like protein
MEKVRRERKEKERQRKVSKARKAEKKPINLMNGVDLDKLSDTIEAIGNDPELANFNFRVKNNWIDGAQSQTRIDDFYGVKKEIRSRKKPFVLESDEPNVLLGKDKGPNPTEHALGALAACMTAAIAYHAAGQGIEVKDINSKIEGDIDLQGFLDLDPNVRNGFNEVRVKFNVKSDADKATLEKFAKMSPVYDIITNPVPVKIEFNVN